jgi:hypothetical protein
MPSSCPACSGHPFKRLHSAYPGSWLRQSRPLLTPPLVDFASTDAFVVACISIRQEYESAYARMKPDKKLRWLPQLGSVTVELELRDRTLKTETTPLQAAIVELFGERGNIDTLLVHPTSDEFTCLNPGEKDTWTTEELAKTLEMGDELLARNALYFWTNQGVVKESKPDVWILLEEADETGQGQVARGEPIHPTCAARPSIQLIYGSRHL